MTFCAKSLYLLLCLMLVQASFAKDLTPSRATYALTIDGKKGVATRTLSQNGNQFIYSIKARAGGIASANQSATFRLNNGQIVPTSASTSYKIAGIGNTHAITFKGKEAISTYKGKSATIATPMGGFDELSLEAQIRQELLNDRFSGNYTLIKKTDGENVKFRRGATGKTSVPAGTFETVLIERLHDDKGRKTRFWLAKELDYLPIKLAQSNDGKTITMALSKID